MKNYNINLNQTGLIAASMLAATAPWQGLEIDVGLRITAFRISIIFGLVWLLSHKTIPRISLPGHLLIFWSIIYSLTSIIIWHSEFKVSSWREGDARAILQIIMLVLSLSPIIIVGKAINRYQDVYFISKIYVLSVLTLSVVGWIQLSIWYIYDIDILPIGLGKYLSGAEEEILRTALLNAGSQTWFRMSSLAGEPKVLGQSCVVAIVIVLLGWNTYKPNSIVTKYFVITFLVLTLIATISASAFVIMVLSIVVIIAFMKKKYVSIRRSIIITSLIVLVPVIGVAITSEYEIGEIGNTQTASLYDLVYQRLLERGLVDDYDYAVLNVLNHRPELFIAGVGLGRIHLFVDNYVTSDYAYLAENIVVAKSGYLRWMSEVGIIGLGLLFLWHMTECVKLLKVSQYEKQTLNINKSIILIVTICFAVYMARSYLEPQWAIALGSVLGLTKITNRINKYQYKLM